MKQINEIITDQDFNELWAECMDAVIVQDKVFFRKKSNSSGMDVDTFSGILAKNFDPVNDMSRCWMLVDMMDKQHGFGKFNGLTLTKEKNNWYCEFPLPDWMCADGDTPQKAVILASALALGKIKE